MPVFQVPPIGWTDEKYAQLKKLRLEKRWPFSKCAKCLWTTWNRPVTKNQLIGKMDRKGDNDAKFEPYTPPPLDWILAKPGHCAWPIGHPGEPDFHCCGSAVYPGKPYCAAHAAVAYVRPKPEKVAA